tara:strand:- start:370 stop:1008 length:639 start_codon:yes stop_codon:yes gene_type:complete
MIKSNSFSIKADAQYNTSFRGSSLASGSRDMRWEKGTFDDPATIWISGVTASGKTTLGLSLVNELMSYGVERIKQLDGDKLRKRLKKNYGHSLSDRVKLIDEYIKIAQVEINNGFNVVISTVSHKSSMRDIARSQLNPFMEVNLVCSYEECAKRDYKNIYTSFDDTDKCLPGYTEPYEISKSPELILDTENNSIEDCKKMLLQKVLNFLSEI